ncbi:MAG: M1 family aminopeptidase [Cytophagales bacterium]|nr:M1 family aminopeptidase [Cytophagales bacterium]
MKVDHYFLPQDAELARKNLEMVPKMLEVYERYFGPYPFQEDGFKMVQSPYPMEHQSCVAVGPYFDDFLILHETAHEWWGNNVSITDNADIWIHEAFATYAESLYLEATLGYEMGQRYLNSRKSEILNDHPVLGIRNVNHFHYRIEDKYTKGSLMINTLRQMVDDDELWFETLKAIQEDFRHGFIDTETLINFMELQLEMDLSSFFEQYLQTTQIPTLEMKQNDMGFSYRWTHVVDGFDMPLRIGEMEIIATAEWQQTTIDLGQKFKKQLMDAYLIQVIALDD